MQRFNLYSHSVCCVSTGLNRQSCFQLYGLVHTILSVSNLSCVMFVIYQARNLSKCPTSKVAPTSMTCTDTLPCHPPHLHQLKYGVISDGNFTCAKFFALTHSTKVIFLYWHVFAFTHMHTHTHTHTQCVSQCMLVFHDGAAGWVSEVFVRTDARRACSRGVIGSTMGAYPKGTGSNPVEGNGCFFSLMLTALSFVFLWHTRTRTRARAHVHTTSWLWVWPRGHGTHVQETCIFNSEFSLLIR